MDRIAALVLSGRLPAFALAALLGLIPLTAWASAVVVCLVALRKGLVEALWPLLGATIPAVMAWNMGDTGFMGMLLSSLIGALVLGSTQRLDQALLVMTLAGSLLLLCVLELFPDRLEVLEAFYRSTIDQLAMPELKELDLGSYLVQSVSWSVSWIAWLTLLAARWQQARLFNPGGFKQSFHRLRLKPAATGGLLIAMMACQYQSGLEAWMSILVMPLVMAGVALIHGWVGLKKQGASPLWVMYIGFLPPFVVVTLPVLLGLAVVDSFVDFRNRAENAS
jgi:hypothetical protein